MHCVLCFMLCASGDILFIPIKCVYFRSFLQVFGLTRRLAWSISMAFSSLWECCFFIAFRATSHCTWAICFSFYYSYVRHNVGISGIFESLVQPTEPLWFDKNLSEWWQMIFHSWNSNQSPWQQIIFWNFGMMHNESISLKVFIDFWTLSILSIWDSSFFALHDSILIAFFNLPWERLQCQYLIWTCILGTLCTFWLTLAHLQVIGQRYLNLV